MIDDVAEPDRSHAVEATCPECKLELTGSKLVEKVKPTERHPLAAEVFYCPECGRFFRREPAPSPETS